MSNEEKEHQFKTRFPVQAWKDLEVVAKDEERSINWIVVQAVREYTARHKKRRRKLPGQEEDV